MPEKKRNMDAISDSTIEEAAHKLYDEWRDEVWLVERIRFPAWENLLEAERDAMIEDYKYKRKD